MTFVPAGSGFAMATLPSMGTMTVLKVAMQIAQAFDTDNEAVAEAGAIVERSCDSDAKETRPPPVGESEPLSDVHPDPGEIVPPPAAIHATANSLGTMGFIVPVAGDVEPALFPVAD